MWTDGQTDMTKLIVVFHNFAKAPKNCFLNHIMSLGTSRELEYVNLFGE